MMRSLYSVGGIQFVFPEPAKKGVIGYESSGDFKAKNQDDAVVLSLKSAGKEEEITLVGSKGKMGEPKIIKMGAFKFTYYGSKVYKFAFLCKAE